MSEARAILSRIGGGSTALPPADGTWEKESGDILWEQTRLVYCFVNPDRFEAQGTILRQFLHRFGRETNQGEVVVEFDGRFFRIKQYDEPRNNNMAKKITVTGNAARRIEITGQPQRRIEPEEFAAVLGAEPCGEPHAANLDPLALAELGHELIKRLRSSGGRPALPDATERCKVPLTPDDLESLEAIATQIQRDTGSKPSLGQIASVILRAHLDSLKNPSATTPQPRQEPMPPEPLLSLNLVQQMIEEQLRPLREKVSRLESERHVADGK